jgi:hypothetical protein
MTSAPADDAVLLLAREGGEHSFGHGPLDAPAGIPRMNLRGLIELARDQLGRHEGLSRPQGESDDAVNLPLARPKGLLIGHRWATEAAAAGNSGPQLPCDQAHADG